MINYKQYRWFYTSSKTLVVGGKNASQNDELLRSVEENYYVMHTKSPGSPFCILIKPKEKVSKQDLDECATFTGCFSRAWKEGKKSVEVDIFSRESLHKDTRMKTGTWAVRGPINQATVELKLILTKQKGVLRAVPLETATKGIIITPGSIEKEKAAIALSVASGMTFDRDELAQALPAGGIRLWT